MSAPWHAYALLIRPGRVREHLSQLVASGVLKAAPNLWQVELGVLRMWHRVVFRSDTIGTCADPVRPSLRARLLRWRPLRLPFLVAANAIAPFDNSGLVQSPQRLINHLLTAHHDAAQFAYDLEILGGEPGALEAARDAAASIVDGSDPRAEYIADLCVHVGYHARLLTALDDAIAGRPLVTGANRDDPDISFNAFIRWCAVQPETPMETLRAWRRGAFPRAVRLAGEA